MQFNQVLGLKLPPRETVESVDSLYACRLLFGTRGDFLFKTVSYAKQQSHSHHQPRGRISVG